MSIAIVRIAPVERWCTYVRSCTHHWTEKQVGAEVGMLVEIDTASMKVRSEQSLCAGKEWLLTLKSVKALLERIGSSNPVERMWICEHMLEMD